MVPAVAVLNHIQFSSAAVLSTVHGVEILINYRSCNPFSFADDVYSSLVWLLCEGGGCLIYFLVPIFCPEELNLAAKFGFMCVSREDIYPLQSTYITKWLNVNKDYISRYDFLLPCLWHQSLFSILLLRQIRKHSKTPRNRANKYGKPLLHFLSLYFEKH